MQHAQPRRLPRLLRLRCGQVSDGEVVDDDEVSSTPLVPIGGAGREALHVAVELVECSRRLLGSGGFLPIQVGR